ncbi:MAG: hypothetical protein GY927_19740 [bacterium]|nr:hypothetical protein [bacterium]
MRSHIVIAALLLAPVLAGSSIAKADSSDIANSLPAQIPEILTGGSWSNGSVGGVYRAVVVISKSLEQKTNLAAKSRKVSSTTDKNKPATERKAEVFIQWISHENGKANAKIVKTVSIREFNEKQLRHAFLAMDTLKDNEMTLLVTSYDEGSDKDISISVKATTPGKYEASNGTQ